jgi:hypothetical protein
MVFTAFVMYAAENNFTQILLPIIQWTDLYGTYRPVPHEKLFDVIHWNSLYPALLAPWLIENLTSLPRSGPAECNPSAHGRNQD